VTGWATVTSTQLLALALLWRPWQHETERRVATAVAAWLPAAAWAPFFLAYVMPGTAVEDEPGHLTRFAGIPSNMVPATLVPVVAGLGFLLHAQGR
jgi:hypothetical protein